MYEMVGDVINKYFNYADPTLEASDYWKIGRDIHNLVDPNLE
jgi:hypothetical protein